MKTAVKVKEAILLLTQQLEPVKAKEDAEVFLSTDEIWQMLRKHYGAIDGTNQDIHTLLTERGYRSEMVIKFGEADVKWLLKAKTTKK